jgi:hypothetical protein
MADHVLTSQKEPKFKVLRAKLNQILTTKTKWVVLAFIIAGLVVLAISIFYKNPHDKASNITQQAGQMAVQGKFNESIQNLLTAYSTEPKLNIKSGIAYKIGVEYYATGSNAEGKKWLQKAAEDYKNAGDKVSAQNATDKIAQLEAVNNTSNVNSAVTNQNAERRGNVQDSSL